MEKYRIDPSELVMHDLLIARGGEGMPAPTITTVLKEKVDVAALTYATHATMAFHPYFATRLMKDGDTFYWQENTEVPIISEKHISEDFLFGDSSNNFFPWVVTYFDHSISFDFSHELTDGGGAATFCATLMEYYARYLNGDKSPIAENGTREERLKSEAALPSEVGYRQDAQAIYQPKSEKVSKFRPEMVGKISHYKRFCIDSSALRKISFSYDASPFALIAPILSRAAMPYLDGEHKIAYLLIPQNTRGYFGSQSLHNFKISQPFYYFDDKMRNMPIEQVATIFRSRLDLLSDISNIEAFYTSSYKMGQLIHRPEVREQAQKAFIEQVFQQTTIAYTHLTRSELSETAKKYISDVYFNITSTGGMIGCFGLNFGDHINLTVSTKFLDDGFYENVCEQLNNLGVGCSMQPADIKGERFFVFHDDVDC